MMKTRLLLRTAFLAMTLAATPIADAAPAKAIDADALKRTISDLDTEVFGAFNRCDLKAFSAYFTINVEFYHDKGGVTWTRRRMLANTRKNICGKVRRELLPESLEVYPIEGFGAIEMGTHKFCDLATNQCEGLGKFVMIWKQTDDARTGAAWKVTRVLSYDHRSAPNP